MNLVKKFLKRFSILCIWSCFIFAILYLPSWEKATREKKILNVFAWGDIIDLDILNDFEKTTGIKVQLSYYSSNEELLVKMEATQGEDYDLILPSDYTVALLIEKNLLKKIDLKRLVFWDDLYPALLNHPFDPDNLYSVPFLWEVYGFGVDTRFFKDRASKLSWGALFDESQIDYKIAMRNDPIEVFLFAASYLFGDIDWITDAQFAQVGEILINQHKWVEAYSNFRPDYFLAVGACPIVLSTVADIKRIKGNFPFIDFVIPSDRPFISIENFCIPKASEKADLIYPFLNFFYTKESLLTHSESFDSFPSTLSTFQDPEFDEEREQFFEYTREEFSKFRFIRNIAPQDKVRDLWVKIKSF